MFDFRLRSRLWKDLSRTPFTAGRHTLQKKVSLRGQWDVRGHLCVAFRTDVLCVLWRSVEPTVGIGEV